MPWKTIAFDLGISKQFARELFLRHQRVLYNDRQWFAGMPQRLIGIMHRNNVQSKEELVAAFEAHGDDIYKLYAGMGDMMLEDLKDWLHGHP